MSDLPQDVGVESRCVRAMKLYILHYCFACIIVYISFTIITVDKQWVSGVLGYSSQYGSDKYSAQQILGAPDVYPGYADDKRAWAPNYIDANQFLEFQFTTSVYVTQLDVYETFNGGGVKAIKCFDVSEKWITLWSTDKVSVKRYPRIFSPSFTSTISCFSNRIKLEIDCTAAGTWVEIDAVMLYGKKEEEQWVSGVIGYSSQYGSDNFSAEAILGVPDMYPTYGKAIAAWAPDVIDENQFLEFQFATPVYVTKVDVYEVYKAGGVKAIKCFDVSEAWITLWSTKQVSVFESARIFSPSFTSERPCFSNHIRLDIDCTVANTWVQIDAVRLHGSKEAVQWANAVIGYSSEYGSDKWSAKQTLGLPDVYPRYADDKKAWAPDVIDAHQYLLLQFATPVYVTQVDVYETFNAGGVKEIVCYDYQENVQRRIRLWSTDKVSAVKSARVFSPSFEVKERTDKLGLVSSNFFTDLNTQLFAWTIRRPLTLDITMLMCYVVLLLLPCILHTGN
ncbi:uncharacterized protein LOC127849779 [Dreissena polymorpha]|uniref:uncharacterized protein LOC127849779 n=1 Tax=Dreissena polymorpha TaxID=45954 RepID=UPI0022654248|nr:uncharacterized protein LOC127849779 [Dreissena polymorpha]